MAHVLTRLAILLWLWKVLPLPRRLRWAMLWLGNAKFLVGADAAIFDEEGRVLLQRHTYRRRHPWGMPGGRMDRLERPAETLVREVAEETGLSLAVGPLVAAQRNAREPNIVLTYLCQAQGSPRLSTETSDVGYFALDALPEGLRPEQLEPIRIAARVRRFLADRHATAGDLGLWQIADAPACGEDEF